MSSSGDDSEDDEGVRTWDQFLAESDGRYAETVRINLADDLKYAPTSSSLPSKKSICYGMCPTADASRLIYVRCTRCDKVVRDVGIAHHLQSRHNYRPQNAVTDYYGDSGDDYQGFLLSPAHCPNVPSTSAEGVGPNVIAPIPNTKMETVTTPPEESKPFFIDKNILLLETNNNLGSPCTSSSRDVSEPMEDTKVKIQKVTRSRKKAMKEPKIKTVIKIEEGSADDASSTGETERFEEKPLHKHPIGANHRVLRSSHSGENGIVFAPTVTTDTFSDGRSMTRSGLLFHDSVSDLVHAESRKRRSRQQFADDDFNLDIKRPKAEIEEIPEEHRLQPTDLEIPKTTRKVLLPRKNGTSIRNKTLGTMPRAIHKDQRADFTHASTPLNGSPSTRFRCENKNVHPASSSKRTSNEGHHAVSKFFSDFLEKTESRVDRSTSKNVDNRHHPKYVANKMLNKRNYSDDHDSNRFLTGANSIRLSDGRSFHENRDQPRGHSRTLASRSYDNMPRESSDRQLTLNEFSRPPRRVNANVLKKLSSLRPAEPKNRRRSRPRESQGSSDSRSNNSANPATSTSNAGPSTSGLRPTSSLAERAKHRTDAEWGEDGTIKTRDPYRRNLNRDRSMDNEEEQRAREPFVWSPNIFKTNLEDNSRRHVSRRHQVAVYRPPAEPSNPPSSISKMTFESSEQLIQGSDSTTHLRSAQMDLETDEMQAEFRMNKAVHTRRNGTSSFLQVGARTSTSNSTSQFNFSKASSTYTYTGSQFPEQVRPVLGLPPLTYTPVNGLSLNGPAIANGTATSAQSVTNSIITGQVITQHITTTTTSTQRTTTVQRTRQGTPRVVDQMDFRPPVLQSNANPPVRRTLRNPNGHVGRMSQRVLTQIPTVRRVLRHDDMPVLEPQQNFAPRMTNGVHRLPAPIVRNPPSNDEANGPRTRRASYNTRQSLPK